MKTNSTTIKKWIAMFFFAAVLGPVSTYAQYCSPTYTNGCSSWKNLTVSLGSLNWNLGSDPCTNYDYTTQSTSLTTGVPHSMVVTNGSWCGCGVWVDLNSDFAFDASENLYHHYQAVANNTYNFAITIPHGTPIGSYRMRVIAGWGTDCFSVSANGYGPCGSYEYGNFDDFTINITGPAGIEDLNGINQWIRAYVNHESDEVTVSVKKGKEAQASLQLSDITGRSIETRQVQNETEHIGIQSLAEGIYVLTYTDGEHRQSIKLMK